MPSLPDSGPGAAAFSAVVVNRDSGDALVSCVASLRAAGVGEVIVVDNASSDGSLARLAAADTDAVLVPTGANLGYGTAANRGASRASKELVLVCNPDLVVDPSALSAMAAALMADTELAAVGPTLLRPDGSRYPSPRAFPGLRDAAGHAALSLFRPDNPFSRRYRLEERRFTETADADWVSGACLGLRKVAFDSVSGFDEGYFMYVEDLDLCWRLHRAGWRVAFVPDAVATHVGATATSRAPYAMLVAHHRSTLRFFVRSAQGRDRWLLPVVAAGLGIRLIASVLQRAVATRQPGHPGSGPAR